jgi:predicted protein tyrosine phosphatase
MNAREKRFRVDSKHALKAKLERGDIRGGYCISILNPDEPEIPGLFDAFHRVLRLRFLDIDSPKQHVGPGEAIMFSPEDLRKIINLYRDFIEDEQARIMTVHCHAGVHRSTAVALIMLSLHYEDPELAMEELIRIRALPLPNRHIIKTAERELNLVLMPTVDDLYRRFRSFVDDEISIDADDYLDELDQYDA